MRSLARLSLQSRFGLKQHQQVVLEVNNSFHAAVNQSIALNRETLLLT